MAAVTVCSDLEPQKIKSVIVSMVSLSICHEVIGPDAMILVFLKLSFNPAFTLSSFTLILFMGFSRQEYRSGLPFPSPVDHILSELFTMTHLSWVALHGMAHSFIESHKAVVHVYLKAQKSICHRKV